MLISILTLTKMFNPNQTRGIPNPNFKCLIKRVMFSYLNKMSEG